MKKMMKLKRRLAIFLVLIVLFALPGIQVFAEDTPSTDTFTEEGNNTADEDNGSSGSEDQGAQENQDNQGSQPSDDVTQGEGVSGQDTNKEEVNSEEKSENAQLEYIFVDEQVVNIPETQNIVVGFKDEAIKLEKAILLYKSVNEDMELQMESGTILNNTVLFKEEYSDGATEGEYQLIGITYKITGVEEEKTIRFADENIEAGYKVTMEQESAKTDAEGVPEVAAYTMDEAGNVLEKTGDTIEDTIGEALEEVGVDDTTLEKKEAGIQGNFRPRSGKPAEAETRAGKNRDLVVVLCAGHDATHTGARGNGLQEEQLTWKVAQYCKAELEQYSGVKVYLDRNSVECAYPGKDTSYCLNQRVHDAKAKGADVFVDIHFNAGGGTGAEVYFPNKSYNQGVSDEGKSLSEKILLQLEALGLKSRGAKIKDTTLTENNTDSAGNLDDYYTTNYLCKQYGFPGIIVEHAFLDHANDAAKLKDESFLKKLGIADATGIAQQYGLSKTGGGSSNATPGIGTVTITNKNDFAGTFRIKITGVTGESKIKLIEVPVWCETNGQDDLKWYAAKKQSDGSYAVDINIKDHKNQMGKYIADVYITDTSGKTGAQLGRASAGMTNAKAKTTVSKVGTDEKQFLADLAITNPPSDIKSVRFAVWSTANGQDDLRWYTATKNSASKYTAQIPISNHKTYGGYIVHTYVTMNDGTDIAVDNSATFSVTQPTVKTVAVQNYNETAGTFDVIISGITAPSGVQKIEVPIWCASDQSDINWYTALKQSDGTYKVSVNIAKHKYSTGVYQIHTYLTDGLGIRSLVNTKSHTVSLPKVTVSAAKTDSTEKNFALKATNVSLYGSGIRNVQFAVWSVNGGQDDLRWYQGTQNATGAWSANVPITNHKTIGEYIVHLYATLSDGTMKMAGSTTFSVTKPAIGSMKVTNMNTNAGTFSVVISGVNSVSGVNEISVPIWCASDQSDIKWYSAKKQSDGTYRVDVNIANHKYSTGVYIIHAYVTTGNGIMVLSATSSASVALPEVTVTATDSAKTEKNYALKATNVGVYGGASNVQFAVWSVNGGQDDLRWYGATQNSQGAWNTNLPISNHKTAGEYIVHTYATLPDGTMKMVAVTSFKITKPSISSVKIVDQNKNKGTFSVVFSGLKSPSGITEVSVPIWCAGDQSDIKWYPAKKQSDGTYRVDVNIGNHKNHAGVYSIHAYISTGNGMYSLSSTSSVTVELPDVNLSITDSEKTEKTFALKATNAGNFGAVQSLEFAVWSTNGGQDDLIWYQARQNNQGAWESAVSINKHKTSGTYLVHIYATYATGKTFIGSGSFNVSAPGASVSKENYNKDSGTFDVISKVTSVSGISKIEAAVWSASNQSDIKWYTPSKQSNGTYKVSVNPANHNNNSGTYQVHIYVTSGNGIRLMAGSTSQAVEISQLYSIMGNATTNVAQMVRYYKSSGKTYPSSELKKGGAADVETFCQIFYEEAAAEGVRAEVAYTQAMKETGWLQFGGDVSITQFNFAGLGATGNGVKGDKFPDVRTGIRAQIQHLKAYASKEPLKNACVDTRFNYVNRGCAPYVEWLGQKENPNGYGWATSKGYGKEIIKLIKTLKSK